MDQNTIVTKLALERCLSHIAHLHAVFYMCKPKELVEDPVTRSVLTILSTIQDELLLGSDTLSLETIGVNDDRSTGSPMPVLKSSRVRG